MSHEKAGETAEVVVSEEERQYQEALVDLRKRKKKLDDWEDVNGDDNERYRELDQRVQGANQILNDAERR